MVQVSECVANKSNLATCDSNAGIHISFLAY